MSKYTNQMNRFELTEVRHILFVHAFQSGRALTLERQSLQGVDAWKMCRAEVMIDDLLTVFGQLGVS